MLECDCALPMSSTLLMYDKYVDKAFVILNYNYPILCFHFIKHSHSMPLFFPNTLGAHTVKQMFEKACLLYLPLYFCGLGGLAPKTMPPNSRIQKNVPEL